MCVRVQYVIPPESWEVKARAGAKSNKIKDKPAAGKAAGRAQAKAKKKTEALERSQRASANKPAEGRGTPVGHRLTTAASVVAS